MFSALGFSLPGGQISAKGGNLVVHIYASRFLPKHYPGGSGVQPSKSRGTSMASARVENSECASCPVLQSSRNVYMC